MHSPFLVPPSVFANQHIDGAILFEKSDKYFFQNFALE
jgi:hypothetical protein